MGGCPQMFLSGSLPSVQSQAMVSVTPKGSPELPPSLDYHSSPWNEFIEEKFPSPGEKQSHSPPTVCLPCTITLHVPSPCPGNLYCSSDVQWGFCQDLPGNLYLLVGKALFGAPSSERRETHLTPSSQPPSACCRHRTTWAMLRTQNLHAAGTLDATQTEQQR